MCVGGGEVTLLVLKTKDDAGGQKKLEKAGSRVLLPLELTEGTFS